MTQFRSGRLRSGYGPCEAALRVRPSSDASIHSRWSSVSGVSSSQSGRSLLLTRAATSGQLEVWRSGAARHPHRCPLLSLTNRDWIVNRPPSIILHRYFLERPQAIRDGNWSFGLIFFSTIHNVTIIVKTRWIDSEKQSLGSYFENGGWRNWNQRQRGHCSDGRRGPKKGGLFSLNSKCC